MHCLQNKCSITEGLNISGDLLERWSAHIFKMAGDDNKNLTNEQCTELVWFLQERSSETNKNGLKRGAIKAAAGEFEQKRFINYIVLFLDTPNRPPPPSLKNNFKKG